MKKDIDEFFALTRSFFFAKGVAMQARGSFALFAREIQTCRGTRVTVAGVYASPTN